MSRDPGLDVQALRARRRPRHDLDAIRERIEAHLEAHDGYVAWSGGKDSTAVLHLALQVDPAVPVAWFDSGLEYPETRAYIEQLARAWRLNLAIIRSQPSVLDVLRESGAWDLDAPDRPTVSLGQVCIDAPAAHAHRLFGAGELWGVRAQESRGRYFAYTSALRRQASAAGAPVPAGRRPTSDQRKSLGGLLARADGTVAYGPIWDWSLEDVYTYLAVHGVPLNPVYERLAALGAPESARRVTYLVDAGHLERGRVTWLRRGWPDLYAELVTVLPRLADFT